jgi:hypothetical protein
MTGEIGMTWTRQLGPEGGDDSVIEAHGGKVEKAQINVSKVWVARAWWEWQQVEEGAVG